MIEIQVFGDESMSTKGRVLADGTITMPLVGPVPWLAEARGARRFARDSAPSFDPGAEGHGHHPGLPGVGGGDRRSRDSQGVVDLGTPAGVLQALAKAGGMTEFADWSGIYVLRSRGRSTQRIRFRYSALVEAEPAAARFQLKTGDVLVVE